MSLPEIPDEAITAVIATFMDPNHEQVAAEREWVENDLRAAWPHLYAAALRHAAEQPGDVKLAYMTTDSDATTLSRQRLRRLADEATP